MRLERDGATRVQPAHAVCNFQENLLTGESMAFKMECPHCKRALNVTDKAIGKTVPCPGCGSPVSVPNPPGFIAPDRKTTARPVRADPPGQNSPESPPERHPEIDLGAELGTRAEQVKREPQPGVTARNVALRDCPDCGAKISRKADSCPHCGCPFKVPAKATEQIKVANANPVSTGFGMAAGSMLFVVLFFAAMLFVCLGGFHSCVKSLGPHASITPSPPSGQAKPPSRYLDGATRASEDNASAISAEPANEVIIDDYVRIAVTKVDRYVADTSKPFGVDSQDRADVTFAFRRLSGEWPHEPRPINVIITDDRGNRYTESFQPDSLRGSPRNIHEMPEGFTWAGRVVLPMPRLAPVASFELFSFRTNRATESVALSIAKPAAPSFDLDESRVRLLHPGTRIDTGNDLETAVGPLKVTDSFPEASDTRGSHISKAGLSLAVPINVQNRDYKPHRIQLCFMAVQFDNGELSDNSVTAGDGEVGGSTEKTITVLANFSDESDESGRNVKAVLLYVDNSFVGFVPISGDARERILKIVAKCKERKLAGTPNNR